MQNGIYTGGNIRKAAIVGCGYVGAAAAFRLMQSGLFSELVLIDADWEKAEGEAMDIGHGVPFARQTKIYAGDYQAATDASVVIVTAGAAQKPGETRLDLVKKNVGILRDLLPKVVGPEFRGILLMVANPVDVLTYAAQKLTGLPENRVIGSGTVLDTARLKYRLSQHLAVDSRSVHAFIIGEHGDSEIAAWSSANVSGIPLSHFCELRGYVERGRAARESEMAEQVRNSAYEIIRKKRATYYGVAMAIGRICEVIVRDEKSILPVSSILHGEYGIRGVALSIPSIVGKNGLEARLPIPLNAQERDSLMHSAQTLRQYLGEAGF